MQSKRVNEIDLLRFLAALVVVFFHYSFRGTAADDRTIMAYPLLAPVAKYGYLGVMRGREHAFAGFRCRRRSSANGVASLHSTADFGQHHVGAARFSVGWPSRDVARPAESFAKSRNSPQMSCRPVSGIRLS